MSDRASKNLNPHPLYSVRPQAVTSETIDELMTRLDVIMDLMSGIPVNTVSFDDAGTAKEQKKQLFIKVWDYLNNLRMVQLLLQVSPDAPGFDDHDQVASSILYRFSEY